MNPQTEATSLSCVVFIASKLMSSFLFLLLQLFCFLLAKQKLQTTATCRRQRGLQPARWSVACCLPWGSILRRITLPFNLRNKVKLSRKQSLWPKSQRNAQREMPTILPARQQQLQFCGNISLDTRHATKSSAEFTFPVSPLSLSSFCSATPIPRSQGRNRNSCTLRLRLTFSCPAHCNPRDQSSHKGFTLHLGCATD